MKILLPLLSVLISLVPPSQLRASTTTYPQPGPPLTEFTTTVTNKSQPQAAKIQYQIPPTAPLVSLVTIFRLPVGGKEHRTKP